MRIIEMKDLITHYTKLGDMREKILNSMEIVREVLESGDLRRGRIPLLLNLELLSRGCLELSDAMQEERLLS